MPNEAKEVIAYQIWEEQGRLHGRDVEHWQEAERRLIAQTLNRSPKAAMLEVKQSAATKKAARPSAATKAKRRNV